jgi:hypothetical protein
MSPKLFPTPEDAAMEGFPAAHCRVLAVDVDGKDGFVLLDTGPAEYVYLYGGTVERLAGGWCGGIDSNGGGVGWTHTDEDVGVVAACGEAPPNATAVRVEWRGESREALVQNGVYLFTWWRQSYPDGDLPQVTAFQFDNAWQAVPRRWHPNSSSSHRPPNER